MPRKVYGEDPDISLPGRPMSNVGDPEFTTDSQNNDQYYSYDTDVEDLPADRIKDGLT